MENTSVNSNNDILTIKKLSKIYHTNKSEIPAIKDLNLNIKKTFQNIIKVNLKNNYKNIKQETLILWGTLDNITPLKDGLLINKLIKNSTLIKLNNCSHFSYLDKKYQVTRIIYEYLKEDI